LSENHAEVDVKSLAARNLEACFSASSASSEDTEGSEQEPGAVADMLPAAE